MYPVLVIRMTNHSSFVRSVTDGLTIPKPTESVPDMHMYADLQCSRTDGHTNTMSGKSIMQ